MNFSRSLLGRVGIRGWTAVIWAMSACNDPGIVWSARGGMALRTALYRIEPRQGAPELVVLLSNGIFSCTLPDAHDLPESFAVAACREGAQHTVLRAYSLDDEWLGEFPGDSAAGAALLSTQTPRLFGGAFYSVEEARLVELEGLGRLYVADEQIFEPDLGDGGRLSIKRERGDVLEGWFSFPREDLSGEFRAIRCGSDTSVLDVAAGNVSQLCGIR